MMATRKVPVVRAVILNWNRAEDTMRCLDSLDKLRTEGYDWQIIVVDNASTNDSVTTIRTAYPSVEIIETSENLGYTGGNNVGIRCSLARGADYVWLLNDDVIVHPECLHLLVQAAKARPNVGFVGPLVRIWELPDHILSAGGVLGPGMQARQRGLGERDRGAYTETEDLDFLSGCALLVSRPLIDQIGMLDEEFFAYGEDVEWCVRGKQAGFKTLFVPDAIVWHPDTRLRDENSAQVMYYISRNQLLLLRRHRLGAGYLLLALLQNMMLLMNWTLNPKWRSAKPKRDALWLAMRDFALGRFGKSRDL